MAHDFYTVTDGLEVRLQEASQDIKDVNTENKSRYNMLQRDVQSAARDIANVALDLNKMIDDLADHKQLAVTKLTAVHQALTAFMCESQAQITRFEQHSMTQGENLKLQLADLSSKFTSYISRLTLDLAVVREATARNEEEVSTLVHEMRELKPLMVDILSQLQELQSARDDANSSASRSTELEVQFSGRRSLFDEMQASVSTEPALPHPALDDIRKVHISCNAWQVVDFNAARMMACGQLRRKLKKGTYPKNMIETMLSTLVDEIVGEGNNVIAAQPGATPPEVRTILF
ncbi:hypothetical protein NLJ89_g11669 [Agrocybe chaxingu]|uniref:Uncharacterized protein n=1 Tax=Agrocybe chaxingu TaxID=84603 RepID=A0A9W8JPJ5_9AGAR|nr:hypothetical protein NLJ89_g11669 [Agrocybe chaxingu]